MGDIIATVVVLGLFGIAFISITSTETIVEIDRAIAEEIRRRRERRANK